jgi:hypothetical protein
MFLPHDLSLLLYSMSSSGINERLGNTVFIQPAHSATTPPFPFNSILPSTTCGSNGAVTHVHSTNKQINNNVTNLTTIVNVMKQNTD